MKRSLIPVSALLLSCALVIPAFCFAQEEVSSARLDAVTLVSDANPAAAPNLPAAPAALTAGDSLPAADPVPQGGSKSSPRVGVGVTAGLLGIGGEVGVRVLRSANVRFGFTGLGISHSFSKDQIDYAARVRLESARLTFDYFVFSHLHVSPGVLLYNGIKVSGNASAPAGNTITLNHVDYNMIAPLTGSVAVTFRRTAPMVLFGFGNLVPRGSRHWSITSDFGVAFSGAPNAALSLAGTACLAPNTSGPTCADVATDPTIHTNVIAEQTSVNDKLKFFKIYPVIAVGFGYSF